MFSEDKNRKKEEKTTTNKYDIYLGPSTFVVMKMSKAPSIHYKCMTLIRDCFEESVQNYR